MTISELHNESNSIYQANFKTMIKGFRENSDPEEMSYNLEEVFDDTKSLGDLIDYLVENEKCTIWDTPYIAFSILKDPENTYKYFIIE